MKVQNVINFSVRKFHAKTVRISGSARFMKASMGRHNHSTCAPSPLLVTPVKGSSCTEAEKTTESLGLVRHPGQGP